MVEWWVAALAAAAAAWWAGAAQRARYLRPLALHVVATDGPSTGLDVIERLAGLGFPPPSPGVIYPVLRQLEREGRLASERFLDGRGRVRLRYFVPPPPALVDVPAERPDDAP